MPSLTIVLLILLIFTLLLGVSFYALMAKREVARDRFLQIDASLQQRHMLVYKLVDMLDDQIKSQEDIVTQVMTAQNTAQQALRNLHLHDIFKSPELIEKMLNAEQKLNMVLQRCNAVIEQKFLIKNDAAVANLRNTLSYIENQVSVAKCAYNDQAMIYNNSCSKFPHQIVAVVGGFSLIKLISFNPDEIFVGTVHSSR